MAQYSKELKESVIARMLPPESVSVPDLVQDTGIPKDTLYAWRSKARKGNIQTGASSPGELSSAEKFNIVLESATLNEVEFGEYCRRKGLFPQQVKAWRETCTQAHAPLASKVDQTKRRNQAKVIKQLEAELQRKEKALAEAAALLILQKKVQLFWEEPEDEKSSCRSASR